MEEGKGPYICKKNLIYLKEKKLKPPKLTMNEPTCTYFSIQLLHDCNNF